MRICADCKKTEKYTSRNGREYSYCKECRNAQSRKRRLKNIAHCRKVEAAWQKSNRPRLSEYVRQRNKKARRELLNRFGSTCRRCGFCDARALQIDHINGGGNKERQGNFMGFYRRLRVLKDEELHLNYQLLCANCNWIKRAEKGEVRIKNDYD